MIAHRQSSYTVWSFTWRDLHRSTPDPQFPLSHGNKHVYHVEARNKRKCGGKIGCGDMTPVLQRELELKCKKCSYFYTVHCQELCLLLFLLFRNNHLGKAISLLCHTNRWLINWIQGSAAWDLLFLMSVLATRHKGVCLTQRKSNLLENIGVSVISSRLRKSCCLNLHTTRVVATGTNSGQNRWQTPGMFQRSINQGGTVDRWHRWEQEHPWFRRK